MLCQHNSRVKKEKSKEKSGRSKPALQASNPEGAEWGTIEEATRYAVEDVLLLSDYPFMKFAKKNLGNVYFRKVQRKFQIFVLNDIPVHECVVLNEDFLKSCGCVGNK